MRNRLSSFPCPEICIQLVRNGESLETSRICPSRSCRRTVKKITNWPPVVAVSCLDAPAGGLKDTTNNIKNSTSGFVINIISEPFVELANATSIDAPPDVDEWSLSGLTKAPSVRTVSASFFMFTHGRDRSDARV